MEKTDARKKIQAEWYEKHTLTPKEVQKLIREKLERARMYHEADRKREAVLKYSR